MNNYDQEFKRIVEGLEIDDKPGGEHRDRLRWQMMSEFNGVRSDGRSGQAVFSRIGRFIMERKFASITAAAVILVAIIIGVTVSGGADKVENNIVDNDQKNGKVKQVVKDENSGAVAKDIDDNGPGSKSLTPAKKEAELKHVQELFAAKDVDGLVEVLKTGSSEGKLAAATYLADMGADSAVEEIKKLRDSWNGKENNPNNKEVNPFAPLVRKIKNTRSDSNDGNAVKGANGKDNANSAAAAVDKDNELGNAFGLKVIDKGTGEVLAGVKAVCKYRLKLGGDRISVEFKTNSAGRFVIEFKDKKPDALDIYFSKDKYVSRVLRYYTSYNGIEIPKNYVMKMEKGVVIGGVVRTENGEPVKGAIVKVSNHPGNGTEMDMTYFKDVECPVDDEGRWQCGGVPAKGSDTYLKVEHKEYVTVERYAISPPMKTLVDKSCVILMRKGLTVNGLVVDQEGAPIAGAEVYQGSSRFSANKSVRKTDSDGRFKFEKQKTGDLCLTIHAKGYAPDLRRIEVYDGMEDVVFVMEPGNTVLVRVLDKNGAGIKGVTVVADQWRSFPGWAGRADSIRLSTSTDGDGLAVITDAPKDKVYYTIYKKGMDRYDNFAMVPSDQEYVITLNTVGKLKGKVYDQESLEPIEVFTMIEGIKHTGENRVAWQPHRAKRVKGGEFEVATGSKDKGTAVQIVKEGYLSGNTKAYYNDGSEIVEDVYLVKDIRKGVVGVVYDSDGNPANKAEVYVVPDNFHLFIENNQIQRHRNHTVADTDENGIFEFSRLDDDYKFFVIHKDGTAYLTKDNFEKENEIILKKWGSVEGKVYNGSKAAAGQEISISVGRLRLSAYDEMRISYQLDAVADENGRFVFNKVLPDDLCVAKVFKTSRSHSYSCMTHVKVEAGKRSFVEIGGGGRIVTGKIELPEGIDAGDISTAFFNIEPRGKTKYPKTDMPEEYFVMSTKERQDWQSRWNQTEEGKSNALEFTKIRMKVEGSQHPVNRQPNGYFAVEDVLPGEYEITGRFYGHPQDKGRPVGDILSEVSVPFDLPDNISAEELDKPFDIGVVKSKVQSNVEAGDTAPDFELETVGGRKIRLKDYAGKHLLIEFLIDGKKDKDKHTEALKQVYDKFGDSGKLEILSIATVSLYTYTSQSTEKAVAYYKKYHGIGWDVETVKMAKWPLKLYRDYGMKNIQSFVIVDPDGKIEASRIDYDSLLETVAKCLAADE